MSTAAETQYNSPESTNQYGAVPPMPDHKPTKAKKKWLVPLLIAVALLFGAGIGNATAAAKPAEIQIQTKEVEKVVEKKVNVPVLTTPASCTDAITYAEQIMSSSARAVGVMGEMFKAAARLDAATITSLSPKIDDETAVLNGIRPKYQSARDSCQASR